ncbi:hypothetical protein [Roseateles chitosanitabidus]|uniref:hypothetical protein n=1 Tax=Roseateles chitosanitabidus TaxID=65048 RepID=UPI0011DF0B34|nr:hypothetical protein [Roseateles chitosanitabidus]
MTRKVEIVSDVWLGSDGQRLVIPVEGTGVAAEDALARRAQVLALAEPRKILGCVLTLDDGTEVSIDAPMLPALLPDRSGILGIFPPSWYINEAGDDVFGFPNNAAVFNVDGTLRFQVNVGKELIHHIALVYGVLDGKFSGMLGLHVAFGADCPPEQIYALDSAVPGLIPTLHTVRF